MRAFDATAALLARFGVSAGAFSREPAPPIAPGEWQPKHYRSIYVPLAARFRMIDELWSTGAERLTGARVVDAERVGDQLVLRVEHEGDLREIRAANLIIATGRWSPRWIRPWLETSLGATFTFRHVEVGVRLETRATSPLFARLPGVDGKLRLVEPDAESRTFCTCRDGEVIVGESHGIRAFSGRADGLSTGRSNVGLLLRTTDEELGTEIAAAAFAASPESLDLAEWRAHGAARLAHVFGLRGAERLTSALRRFETFCPDLASNPACVLAPAIEGVGHYPVADGSLRVAPGVWIAGDVGGRFRGIVAAMVSGRYAAQRLMAEPR